MFVPDWPVFDAVLNWLSNGLLNFSGWQVLAVTLVLTHITIASVTILFASLIISLVTGIGHRLTARPRSL